ncbi:2-oxoglutarate receptor 1-like [Sceloporus undulatus]|uniref:2-oxoglutarate receptor 1-like n=1 Tax=Sceloporus undulatus TaxID=8520 RepID=UPI001C4B5974|nr:2-oxoglutarate receptor 1-like [Sceloporus undulatus]
MYNLTTSFPFPLNPPKELNMTPVHTDSRDTANFSLQNLTIAFGNCTDEGGSFQNVYLSLIYTVLFLVCFPGNIFVISVYVFKMKPWKSSTIIMLNLAITDLLYVSCLPFLIHYAINGENWIFGNFMCKFIRFNFYFNTYSSILFLTCFSLFRFVVIIYPMSCFSIQKRRWAIVACIVVWVLSLLAVSPMIYLITTKQISNRLICTDLTNSEPLNSARWFNWILTIFGFFLPLVAVTLCYAVIIYTLAQGPSTGTTHKQKARMLAIVLLAVFYVCFLPFHIFRGLRIELKLHPVDCSTMKQVRDMFAVTRSLASLNTFGNLILYVLLGDNFQQAFLSICKMFIKSHKK